MSLIINDLSNICLQRSRRQLLNVPPVRFDLISPYGGAYSMFDLDMRRKAEVLKYSANASTTQTNNPTKKQLFSQLVNNTNNSSVSKRTTNCVTDSCGNLILRPTTDSDVPGPVIYLYDDETVPLYNYATNTRSYPDQMPNDFKRWNVYTSNDISCNALSSAIQYNQITQQTYPTSNPSTSENKLFTLYILNYINKNSYTYTVRTPLSVFIQGRYSGSQATTLTISLNTINVNVYYNTTIINGPTFPTRPHLTGLSNISLTIPANAGNFSANVYIGNFVFLMPNLPTLNGYVFDIKLKFFFNSFTSLSDISLFTSTDNIYLNTYMNTTQTSSTQNNCSVSLNPTPGPYSGFSLTGS